MSKGKGGKRTPREAMMAARQQAAILADRVDQNPGDYRQWLIPQWAFLQEPGRRVLLRAGNQVYGKTTAGLTKVVDFVEGRGQFTARKHKGPVEAWIITASWSQSVAIQKKLWTEIDKSKLAPGTVFDEIRGFKGKNPAVKFIDGSIIRIKTTQQGGLNLASATIDAALFDEPPASSRIYGEVQKRVLARGGYIWMTLTPINAPVGWLQELVEKGRIVDIHYPLRAEFLIPVGSDEPFQLLDGTICDAAWVEAVRKDTLPHEVPVVCDGEWECRILQRVFAAFTRNTHVTAARLQGRWKLCLGLDYGSKIGKQVAILLAVDDSSGGWPKVVVLGESVGGESTSTADDAKAILALLQKHGISWKQLHSIWGDRVYVRGAETKSNKQMMQELAELLKIPLEKLQPRIRTVKRGAGRVQGSVDAGCRWLHQLMVRPGHFTVMADCPALIEAFDKWDGRDDTQKDHIDALRYALQDWIFGRRIERDPPTVRIR